MRSKYKPSDISLYVPCYNAGATIGACLEAVGKQTARPRRVMVIDDGSEVRYLNPEIEVIRHDQNRGLAAARNTALKACDTRLIASLDADVLPDSTWLERLLDAINAPSCSGTGGMMTERYSENLADRWRAVHMAQNWGDTSVRNPRFLFGANTLYKTQVLKGAGGYDERHRSNDEDRTISDLLYAQGHDLVYEPKARCEHLRRDTLKTILAGYWQWHHSKGLLNGDFDSPAGILSRIERVNFGIYKYRVEMDHEAERRELLPLDMLLPWVFCAMDLRMLNQHAGLDVPHFPSSDIMQAIPEIVTERILAVLPQTSGIKTEVSWGLEYVTQFRRNLESSGWLERLDSSKSLWRALGV
jgi:glycosyltransferase involved in cell wall biosynthesis